MNEPKNNKIKTDLIFNFISLGVIGVLGIGINVIITKFEGPIALGIFNQVYSIYILVSQVAAFGFQNSVLKKTSEQPTKDEEILVSALILTFFMTSLCTAIFCLSAGQLSQLLGSDKVQWGVYYSATGLFFFALNKVLLAHLNGKSFMKSFAIFSGLRYVLIISAVIILIQKNVEYEKLLISLSVGELFLFFSLFIYLIFCGTFKKMTIKKSDFVNHFQFGLKSFPGGLVTELNTKVDVLMIGYFLSDKVVGIYSFAAVLMEGFAQIIILVRNIYNPIFTREMALGNWSYLIDVAKKIKLRFSISFAILSILATLTLYFLQSFISILNFNESLIVFSILMTGLTIHSYMATFLQIPLLRGFPGHQTLLLTMTVVVNIIANGILVPQFGLYGAAIGTSFSFLSANVLLKVYSRKLLGNRLFF